LRTDATAVLTIDVPEATVQPLPALSFAGVTHRMTPLPAMQDDSGYQGPGDDGDPSLTRETTS
jgi:hypothetical protein